MYFLHLTHFVALWPEQNPTSQETKQSTHYTDSLFSWNKVDFDSATDPFVD